VRGKMGKFWSWLTRKNDGEIDRSKITNRIVTLQKGLNIIPKNVIPYIEIKADYSDRKNIKSYLTPKKIYKILYDNKLLKKDKSVVWAWEYDFLKELREMAPDLTLGNLLDKDGEFNKPVNKKSARDFVNGALKRADKAKVGISMDYRWLLAIDRFGLAEGFIEQLHTLGQKMSVWTVNFEEKEKNIDRLFELNIDEIESDQPVRMQEYRDQLEGGIGNGTVIVAHRNNDEYMLRTVSKHVKRLEVDVMVTIDGVPILFHDHNIALKRVSKIVGLFSSSPVLPENPGGIDFNPNNLNFQEQGQAGNFKFTTFPNIQPNTVYGVLPVIINITPVVNFPLLLGLSQAKEVEQISLLNQ